MANVSMTLNSAGNGLASQSLAASASVSFNVDVSAAYEGQVQVGATFGTMSATAGLQVQVYTRVGSTPVNDTVAGAGSVTLTAASGAQAQTIRLATGRYSVKLTNLDASNGLTAVYSTFDTVIAA